jgi:hypothetical protein
MKRRFIPYLAAAALLLGSAGSVAAEDAVYKFACADITGGSGVLTPNTSGTYDFSFNLTTPTKCGGMIYTMHVFDDQAACEAAHPSGDTSGALATLTVRGAEATADGTAGQAVFGAANLSSTDGIVWIFATTSKGKTSFDVAPDEVDGCQDISEFPPAAGKFR